MSDIVRYERADGVAVVTLNRPDAMNAFTSQLSIDLLAALEQARNDTSVRAAVLTGEGRCFSAGADLKGGLEGRTVFGKLQYEYRPVMTAVASMPKPVIAAVPGSAAGIGLSLALTSDSSSPKAAASMPCSAANRLTVAWAWRTSIGSATERSGIQALERLSTNCCSASWRVRWMVMRDKSMPMCTTV